jgi:hypothetical protein
MDVARIDVVVLLVANGFKDNAAMIIWNRSCSEVWDKARKRNLWIVEINSRCHVATV